MSRTNVTVCLALLGVLSVEALLHKNPLNMFVNMIRNENSVEYEKVQVGKDQEKAQSEKDSHSKIRGGKKSN